MDAVTPPEEFDIKFTQFLTQVYIKKGDFDTSIERLKLLREKNPKEINNVVKGLRELSRISPKNVKVLYALAADPVKSFAPFTSKRFVTLQLQG